MKYKDMRRLSLSPIVLVVLPALCTSFIIANNDARLSTSSSSSSLISYYAGKSPHTSIESDHGSYDAADVQVLRRPSSSSSSSPSSSASDGTAHTRSSSPVPQSKRAREFATMVSEFAEFDDVTVECVPSRRYRKLYYGVRAAAHEPAVYRAFEVLYEDVAPLRVAGRMIFGYLSTVVERAVRDRAAEERVVLAATGLRREDVHVGRRVFRALVGGYDTNGHYETYLTTDRLLDAVLPVDDLLLVRSSPSHQEEEVVDRRRDDLSARFEVDRQGRLTFAQFMIGLQGCVVDADSPGCTLTSVLAEMELHMDNRPELLRDDHDDMSSSSTAKRRCRHDARFDRMVAVFEDWEKIMPSHDDDGATESRMADVVRGCFTGAKNPAVVEGLKIVYTDYTALRLAGDLVFKLASKIVDTKIPPSPH